MTRTPLLALAAAAALTTAGAQTRSDSLPPLLPRVAVTATRTTLNASAQPITTSVFDREALAGMGVTQVADVLRLVPGASLLPGGSFGAQTALFLRGGESDYTQVLVDGVPLNAPGGFVDLGQLTLDNIERVEVVRGPASLLYGADAVTGVIQLFTRQGTSSTRAGATIGAANFGGRRYEGSASGLRRNVRWSLGAARHATDGILRFNNAFRNDVVSGAAAWQGARWSVGTTLRFTDHTYEFPTDAGGALADSNAYTSTRWLALGADIAVRVRPHLTLRGRATRSVSTPRQRDLADGPADTLGFFGYISDATVTRDLAELRAEATLRATHLLTVSIERARDHERNRSVSLSEFGDYPGALDAARTTIAGVAQLAGNLGDRTTYVLGLRHDDNSAFGPFTTVRAAAARQLTGTTSLRASIGSAFKAPTFFENFATGYTVGNPSLTPERTRTVDVGLVRTFAARGSVGVTAFSQAFRDVIQYTARVPDGAPNYANLAAARADGLELEGRWAIARAWQVQAAYTRLRTEVTDAGADEGPSATFVNGDRLLRRPSDLAVLGARWLHRGATVDLSATYTGERDDRDFNDYPARPISQPAFTRVDLAIAVPLVRRGARVPATALLRADNLLNTFYEPTLGFRAPGRTVFVGLRVGS